MKQCLLAAVATLLLAAGSQIARGETEAILDPANDYFERFQTPADLRLDIDLDGDGYPESFLSNERLQNGRAGRIWTVYQGMPQGGWRFLEKPVTFRAEPLKIDPATKDKPAGLLTFWPGGAGVGAVQRIGFANGQITESKVEEISESAVPEYFDAKSPSAIVAKSPESFMAATLQPTFTQTARPSFSEESSRPRAVEQSRSRPWIVAGVGLLLVCGVLFLVMKRKWE